MTLDNLDGLLFADVAQVASIFGCDERTVRKAAAAGEIPASRIGNKWMIPTAWLRQRAGVISAPEAAAPDLDELVDRLADRVFARFARLFGERAKPETGETT